ncbi:MAG: Rrf2 family transcriptional regulator [Candidatus Marinimicrobia bacterium]|nr:Rrf2 family transcriptional regulator [Candidatus Neomarinimicrobiota bacterium]
MLFSKSCDYAIQAVVYLASASTNNSILQKDISSALGIPNQFLGKILQTLNKHGIVKSQKGIDGGFSLICDPDKISLYRIIQIIDGVDIFEYCLLGFPGCDDSHPCPLHEDWGQVRSMIISILKKNSVAKIGSQLRPKLDYIRILQESVQVNRDRANYQGL